MSRLDAFARSIIILLGCMCVGVLEAKPAAPSSAASSALHDYVSRPDDSFAWNVRQRGKLGAGTYAELILTSQTWHDIVWKHQLFIYRPQKVKNEAQALLLIDGGSWKDSLADKASDAKQEALPERALVFAALADAVGAPVAILRQVPRQPMFDGRKEDQIIALTFSKYIETGDPDWPLLLPMVKSTVRAMDAVQAFAKQDWHTDIEHFTVTGASKRGWTTWLTAAMDPRVNALAPMVINMLNMPAHDKLQLESFGGGYSEQVRDYTERGLQQALATEKGNALRNIVDPYVYRNQLLQPKLIILGTNDAYWPVDSLNVYWNELQGDKYILYVPNNGHGITDFPRVVSAVAALQRSLTGGNPLPKLTWHLDEQSGKAELELTSDVTPSAVRQWTAVSNSRDFRKAEWTSTPVHATESSNRTFLANLARPAKGFNATFLEAEFPGSSLPFNLSTTLHVFGSKALSKSNSGATSKN
jgi:PhoPQ-activated pathogenicity-related protein